MKRGHGNCDIMGIHLPFHLSGHGFESWPSPKVDKVVVIPDAGFLIENLDKVRRTVFFHSSE